MKSVSFIRTAPTALGEPKHSEGYENPLSLDELVVTHPTSTFFMRVDDDIDEARDELGVERGDVLVVDRALAPSRGRLAILMQEGGLVLERLTEANARGVSTHDTRTSYAPERTPEQDVLLWGVVKALVREV